MTITFRVYGLPQTKGSAKGFAIPNKHKPGHHRVIINNDNPKNKNWAATITGVAQEYRPPALLLGPVKLTLTVFLPKPKYVQKSRKKCWPTKKPDLSKVTRSVEDALTGVIWKDDAQVVESEQIKVYDDSPGVHILVTTLDDAEPLVAAS